MARKADTTAKDTVPKKRGTSKSKGNPARATPKEEKQENVRMMDDTEMGIIEFGEDISDAEAPEPLPQGVYPAEVTSATAGESKSSGRLQITTRFRVSPDDYPADYPMEHAPDGFERSTWTPCGDNPNGRHRTRQLCEALGVPASKNVDLSDFIGKTCRIQIAPDTNLNGEPDARIVKVLPAE